MTARAPGTTTGRATDVPVPGRRPARVARAATHVPAVLVVLALPVVRPNLFGESGSVVGLGLLVLAALAWAALRVTPGRAGGPAAPGRAGVTGRNGTGPAAVVVLCVGLGYLWLLVQAAANDAEGLGRPALQGSLLTIGALVAVLVLCADTRSRLSLGRAFVAVVVALCVSFVVTAAIWAVAGIGTGVVARVPVGTVPDAQPFYFPLTPTLGTQQVFDVVLPRFTGLGREPGWMAMYCAVTWFLTDMVGWRARWIKIVLAVGLLGCLSTAGFGVFVVAWTYHVFLRDRGAGISVGGYLRQVLGLAAMGGAVWVAVAAPVLGLSAKSTQNATSLDERRLATEAGLRALSDSPLGGPPTEAQGGINLVSDIAVSGLPFVVLVAAALLVPVVLHRGPARFGNAPLVVVFLTLLVSQPAKDSTWAFAVAVLAVALRASDMEQLVPAQTHTPSEEDDL